MASWAPDEKPGMTVPLMPLLVSCLVGAALWLLLVAAIYGALVFAGWNGAR